MDLLDAKDVMAARARAVSSDAKANLSHLGKAELEALHRSEFFLR